MFRRLIIVTLALLPLAGCGGDKYAGPDWTLSGNWVPVNEDPSPAPYDNARPTAGLRTSR